MIRGAAVTLALLVATTLGNRPALADDILTLYYHERAPYSVKGADGSVHGITADIADKVLKAADIGYRWEDLPSARQMEVIKRDEGMSCGLGWFKRPEREAFAKFTLPIYRDLPTIVVARGDDQRFAGTPTLDALFGDKSLTLLTKTGYSYGAEIDGKIATLAPKLLTDASDNQTMLFMLSKQRVDYMIMAEEEANDLLAHPDFAAAGLAVYHLSNAPAGEDRYLMCSQSVPDELIAKINAAIQAAQ